MGASTISVGHGTNPLKKVASTRMLQQATHDQKNVTHLLMRRVSKNCVLTPDHLMMISDLSIYIYRVRILTESL